MWHVPKITDGFAPQRVGSIQGNSVVSKVILELVFLTAIGFSFINIIPKMIHAYTYLPVIDAT
jgi:hypothetical protein